MTETQQTDELYRTVFREDSDSLRQYCRNLNNSEPLAPEEETELWQQIDRVSARIRDILYTFGFILAEHLKMYRDTPLDSLCDFFFTRCEEPALIIPPWMREIEERTAFMQKQYAESGLDGLEAQVKENALLLSRYPAKQDKLFEWYNVAKIFREHLTPETEEKIFLSAGDFREAMEKLDEEFRILEELRKQILNANLRLVVSIVRPFRCEQVQTVDLIQEGNLGLIKAMDRFDYQLGHRFATYATWWIKQAAAKTIASQSRIIRLPAHMLASISRIRRAERSFIQKNGRDATLNELAEILEMPRERINAIRKMAAQSISLQETVTHDPDSLPLEQILCDEEDENPYRQLAFKFMKKRLSEAVDQLTEREQQLIRMRYGFTGEDPMSSAEVGKVFGLTRERVRQLEIRALKKLRDPKLTENIYDYLQ